VVVDFVFVKIRARENGLVFWGLVWSVVSGFVMGFFGGRISVTGVGTVSTSSVPMKNT
jgi:hypothetical protein